MAVLNFYVIAAKAFLVSKQIQNLSGYFQYNMLGTIFVNLNMFFLFQKILIRKIRTILIVRHLAVPLQKILCC